MLTGSREELSAVRSTGVRNLTTPVQHRLSLRLASKEAPDRSIAEAKADQDGTSWMSPASVGYLGCWQSTSMNDRSQAESRSGRLAER